MDGPHRERDYCILTLFLNCGLRISELIGLDITDIQDDALRVLGKGNKVRVVYLNDACKDALDRYLAVRRPISGKDRNALFLSEQNRAHQPLHGPRAGKEASVWWRDWTAPSTPATSCATRRPR